MSGTVPVEGITLEPHTTIPDAWLVRWPDGESLYVLHSAELEPRGIPIPRPPRVGPGGISEESAREIAQRIMPLTDVERAGIIACRGAVAEWDAEDAERAS